MSIIKCAICDKEMGDLPDGAIVEQMEQFAMKYKCSVLGFGPGIFHDQYHTNLFICAGKCVNSQAARWLAYFAYKLRGREKLPYSDKHGNIRYRGIEVKDKEGPRLT